MSSTEDGLLRAIVTEPDDDTHRLVYADWLDDHGDPVRAEFIRAQVQLARDPTDSPERRTLAFRARQLLDQHEAEWAAVLEGLASEWTFRRGFIEVIRLHQERLVGCAQLFAHLPIRILAIHGLEGRIGPLADLPPSPQVLALDLTGNQLNLDGLQGLQFARPFSGLERLSLQFNHLDDAAIPLLTAADFCRRTGLLRLGGNYLSETGRNRLRVSLGSRVSFVCEREEGSLYTFTDQRAFVTGWVTEQRQVLILVDYGGGRAAFFDPEGNLLSIERRGGPPGSDDHQLSEHLQEELLDRWTRELNLTPAPIRVKRFRFDESEGVRDFSRNYEEWAIIPGSEDANAVDSWIRYWQEENQFAWDWSWGSDWWLDRDTGEVTAT